MGRRTTPEQRQKFMLAAGEDPFVRDLTAALDTAERELAQALAVVEAVRAHCTIETPPEIMAALAALESPPEGTEGTDTPAPVEPEPGSPGDASGAPDGGTCSHDVRTGVSTGASGGIWTCALCGTSWVDDDAVPERGHAMTPHSNYRPRDECVPIRCRHCGIPEPDQADECKAPTAEGRPSTLQPRTRYAIESPHGIEWEDR